AIAPVRPGSIPIANRTPFSTLDRHASNSGSLTRRIPNTPINASAAADISHPPHQLSRARGIAPVANLQVKQLLSQRPGPNLLTALRLHPVREFPIPLVVGVRVLATARFAVRVPAVPRSLVRAEHVERLALAATLAFLHGLSPLIVRYPWSRHQRSVRTVARKA